MVQRKKKATSVPKTTASTDRLTHALAKLKKADLIDVIVEIACADHVIMRQLKIQFSEEALPKELVAETRQAIVDATDFDEREMNYNFRLRLPGVHHSKALFRRFNRIGASARGDEFVAGVDGKR